MLHFESDYLEGAHPALLSRLLETNLEQAPGYGSDPWCESAREKIRAACGCPRAAVHFLVGGTQTNAVVIDALLARHEGVLTAVTGHINGHEAGAVEACGHKVLPLPQKEGKLSAAEVRRYLARFYADESCAHMVAPGMVYLSHPTEYGTLYTAAELRALHEVCAEYRIPLFLDGARLGYGLAAAGNDLTLAEIARCCDAFYIGGTKVGALCGEAVVFPDPARAPHFFTVMKQRGALLAKGRLLGVQFDALFTGGLYERIAAHGVRMAERLKEGLARKGARFYLETPTNQQFVILENGAMERLARDVGFTKWEALDEGHTVVRLATSWATREEDVDALLALF